MTEFLPYATGRIPRLAEVIFFHMYRSFLRQYGEARGRSFFYATLRGVVPHGPFLTLEGKPWPRRLVDEAIMRGDLDPRWVEANRKRKTIKGYLRGERENPLTYDESLRQLSRARGDLIRAQGRRGPQRALYAGRAIGRAGAVVDEGPFGSIVKDDASRLQFDAATVGLTRRNPLDDVEAGQILDDMVFDSERAADTRDPTQRAYYAGRASGRARTVLNQGQGANTARGFRDALQFDQYVRLADSQAGVGSSFEPRPRRNPLANIHGTVDIDFVEPKVEKGRGLYVGDLRPKIKVRRKRNPFALGEALATGAAFGVGSEIVTEIARRTFPRRQNPIAPFIYTVGNPGTHRGQGLAPVYQGGERAPLKLPRHLYKGTITIAEAIRRNIPGIREAIKGFTKFHGGLRPDDEVIIINDGRKDQDSGYLIGESPEVTYHKTPEGSNKAGAPWGHETSKTHPTYLASSPRTGMFHLFGGMKATDWLRG